MNLKFETPPLPLKTDTGGTIRVGGTRVTLDTVIAAYNLGSTPEQIAQDYDVLPLETIYAVISFYLQHRAEVDAYLDSRRTEAEQVRQECDREFGTSAIRERLVARRERGRDRDDTSPSG